MSGRAEDAAKEILALILPEFRANFAKVAQLTEIIQRAMDDDFDDRMADAEGS